MESDHRDVAYSEPNDAGDLKRVSWSGVLCSSAVAAALLWSYFPNLRGMVDVWLTQPDYSHGFVVLPISLGMLWWRRDEMPAATTTRLSLVVGLGLVFTGVLVRLGASRYFLVPVENWTIIVIVWGLVLACCGWPLAKWAFPAISFLVFAMPLPYQVESLFRQPLRSLATVVSSHVLVLLGWPAIVEANTIRIGTSAYGVADACSGLRIFWAIAAFGYLVATISRGAPVVRLLFLFLIVPVAVVANVSRIVATCVLDQAFPTMAVEELAHDAAGVVMIPYSLLLLGIGYSVLSCAFPQVEVISSDKAAAGGESLGGSVQSHAARTGSQQ